MEAKEPKKKEKYYSPVLKVMNILKLDYEERAEVSWSSMTHDFKCKIRKLDEEHWQKLHQILITSGEDAKKVFEMTPIICYEDAGKLFVLDGNHRWKAATTYNNSNKRWKYESVKAYVIKHRMNQAQMRYVANAADEIAKRYKKPLTPIQALWQAYYYLIETPLVFGAKTKAEIDAVGWMEKVYDMETVGFKNIHASLVERMGTNFLPACIAKIAFISEVDAPEFFETLEKLGKCSSQMLDIALNAYKRNPVDMMNTWNSLGRKKSIKTSDVENVMKRIRRSLRQLFEYYQILDCQDEESEYLFLLDRCFTAYDSSMNFIVEFSEEQLQREECIYEYLKSNKNAWVFGLKDATSGAREKTFIRKFHSWLKKRNVGILKIKSSTEIPKAKNDVLNVVCPMKKKLYCVVHDEKWHEVYMKHLEENGWYELAALTLYNAISFTSQPCDGFGQKYDYYCKFYPKNDKEDCDRALQCNFEFSMFECRQILIF